MTPRLYQSVEQYKDINEFCDGIYQELIRIPEKYAMSGFLVTYEFSHTDYPETIKVEFESGHWMCMTYVYDGKGDEIAATECLEYSVDLENIHKVTNDGYIDEQAWFQCPFSSFTHLCIDVSPIDHDAPPCLDKQYAMAFVKSALPALYLTQARLVL